MKHPLALVVAFAVAAIPSEWQQPRAHEQMLPDSVDCREPAIAAGPNGRVYVVAGKRSGKPGDKDFNQRQVIWRSDDRGATFGAPRPVSTEGNAHYDHRIAVDEKGTIYISYMDWIPENVRRSPTRLRLARSNDGGDTFTTQTVTMERVSDKPELAVSRDGTHIYIVYTSSPGPRVIASHDGGQTWTPTSVIADADQLHFWPESLAVAPVLAFDARSRAHVVYTKGATPTQPYGLWHRSSADGATWSSRETVSSAARPQSGDTADHDYVSVAANGDRVCAVWVDDRRGALDAWARCSTDAGRTWGAETLLSDRADGAPYKSASGFTTFYGHYGGAGIDGAGRLHAVWAAGEPGYRTGTVWVNSIDIASTPSRR